MIDTGLSGKVALITGANHGIGAATAKALASEEVKVAVHYLAEDATAEVASDHQNLHVIAGKSTADAVVNQIMAAGGQAIIVEGDLSDPATIPALFDKVEDAFGQVDILVNNAAHCEAPDTILQTSAGSLDRTFAVNVRASVLLIAEFARRHKAQGRAWGRVVNLSTDAAQRFVGQIAYGASKATMEAFTRSLAFELGPLGITVNTVAPGPTQTGYITPDLEERLLPDIPLRRIGQPEDIADAIVFLASEQARWLTGQVIKVSGGHEL